MLEADRKTLGPRALRNISIRVSINISILLVKTKNADRAWGGRKDSDIVPTQQPGSTVNTGPASLILAVAHAKPRMHMKLHLRYLETDYPVSYFSEKLGC